MKELFVFLRRFIRPYRKNLIGSVAFNLLSALLNVFSFALIVPILQILFKINETVYEYIPVSWGMGLDAMGRALSNNFFLQGYPIHCKSRRVKYSFGAWSCTNSHDFFQDSLLFWFIGRHGFFENGRCT